MAITVAILIGRHGADFIMAQEQDSHKDAGDMTCIRYVYSKGLDTGRGSIHDTGSESRHAKAS